jgi:hypothetical protein
MPTSDWTDSGFRVVTELGNGGLIVLTCQSQAVTRVGDTFGRGTWLLSQLGVPAATPRSEAERLVKHWLAHYEDASLNERGLAVFRELFSSLKEHVTPEGGSSAPSNVN